VRDLLVLATVPFALVFAAPAERQDASRCLEPLRSPPPPKARPAATCPRDPEPAAPPLARGLVVFAGASGAPNVRVEVARSQREVTRGLMYRTSLDRDRGMLFSFEDERIRRFWMKNTCIPLDMLFLARDGTVVGILEQVPVLNEEPRSVACAAAFVLEVNAGWSRAHGITPGMKASLQL
jgi:uncharacterized membrane protein (UPF0127 family)